MTGLVLLAASDAESRKNFDSTVRAGVDLEVFGGLLAPTDLDAIRSAHASSTVPMWGFWPAASGRQVPKWERIQVGDVATFSGKGGVVAAGTITHSMRCPALADALWGPRRSGERDFSYELMITMADVREVTVPYSVLNPLLPGWSPNATIREVNVYGSDVAAPVVALLSQSESLVMPNAQSGYPAISARRIPIEAFNLDSYVTKRQPEPGLSLRREAMLVRDYVVWLGDRGNSICRHKIDLPEGGSLYTDLFDETANEVIEAKSSSARMHVRTGIGQVLDYAHLLGHPAKALLLPSKPSPDLIQLLTDLGVSVIWPGTDGFNRIDS